MVNIFSAKRTGFFSNGVLREAFTQVSNTLKFTVRSWQKVFSNQVRPERPENSIAIQIILVVHGYSNISIRKN